MLGRSGKVVNSQPNAFFGIQTDVKHPKKRISWIYPKNHEGVFVPWKEGVVCAAHSVAKSQL